MANTKITDLPSANAVGTSVVPVTNAAGNATNKVTLADIAALAPMPTISYTDLTNVPSTFPPPTASSSVLGGVKVGNGLAITDGVLSASDSRWNLFLPPAPTNLSGLAGNAQVVLTWTAPTVLTQAPITDYVVQYSSNNGSTWTTFSDGTSSSTGATVTGLTNGTAYVFRVAAVNGVGTGAYTAASSSATPASAISVSVLVIGGGGSGGAGGNGGGGGAGGYRSDLSRALTPGTTYSVVIGGGGAQTWTQSPGTPSTFDNISAAGGGGGGTRALDGLVGQDGGSGGGAHGRGDIAGNQSPGQGNVPAVTPSQGNSGGNGVYMAAGGGGGAGGAGQNAQSLVAGGGGAGVSSDLTGTLVARAGGGGGGARSDGGTPGAGSAGGGTGGAYDPATTGSSNTGGGGGGAQNDGSAQGAAGGSGVVIIRAPVAAASTTGSPTVTAVSGDTVYTFTGSGSITF
jgi:hypothetical protein